MMKWQETLKHPVVAIVKEDVERESLLQLLNGEGVSERVPLFYV